MSNKAILLLGGMVLVALLWFYLGYASWTAGRTGIGAMQALVGVLFLGRGIFEATKARS